ncbi:Ead domain protein [Klebsiella pneumoniae]|mgnify:CR=1 FL=1|nr:Ead domain protein [Klebsiella pneumoniae]
MTDITELAQREKFEAWFKSSFHPDKTGPYIKDQLYFAWKAAGAELVQALEKAQAAERRWHRVASRIHEQACESDVKIDELEAIRAAAEKLVRCKGRYHSEQNYRALAALFGVNTPDLPPLDGEPRAVTVENLQESAYRAGLTAGWNLGLANNNDGFNKCLAAHAAGIKVEAE